MTSPYLEKRCRSLAEAQAARSPQSTITRTADHDADLVMQIIPDDLSDRVDMEGAAVVERLAKAD